jgi:hypothetical protein
LNIFYFFSWWRRLWYVLLEFVWTPKTPATDADVTTQQEAITSQQPEVAASQQPKAITYQQLERISYQPIQQDPRADMLMSKTLFAAEMLRSAEKEVSFGGIYLDDPCTDIIL